LGALLSPFSEWTQPEVGRLVGGDVVGHSTGAGPGRPQLRAAGGTPHELEVLAAVLGVPIDETGREPRDVVGVGKIPVRG
jgi:hypothetical protein